MNQTVCGGTSRQNYRAAVADATRSPSFSPLTDASRNSAPVWLEHRGVRVLRVGHNQYDFMIDGCCIIRRKGPTFASEVIDDVLDGFRGVDQQIYDHLKGLGFTPSTFEMLDGRDHVW